MKKTSAYIYRSAEFDGKIYVKVTKLPPKHTAHIVIYKDGKKVKEDTGHITMLASGDKGDYWATVTVSAPDNTSVTLHTKKMHILTSVKSSYENITLSTIKAGPVHHRHAGVDEGDYFLKIRMAEGESIEKLKQLPSVHLPLFQQIKDTAVYKKEKINILLGDIIPDTYSITNTQRNFDELAHIANELEQLEGVVYCCVVPDPTKRMPPELPQQASILSAQEDAVQTDTVSERTPDFEPLEKHLDEASHDNKSMNIRAVWESGETGGAATVRHYDAGVYPDHEDLKENITIRGTNPVSADLNHGTAAAGCIAASKNGFGVTGVAYDCDLYTYYIPDDFIRDVIPGDILSLNQQDENDKQELVPLINSRFFWDMCHELTKKGIVTIAAAGNGGLNISKEKMHQYGDSGATLVGACGYLRGERLYFSNYDHPTLLLNSWGGWVYTTGYGDLQKKPGNNRNYTAKFSGTSSATPLCAGALALIQSYAIANYGIYFNSTEMRQLIKETGYTDGVEDKIGYRPNVHAAIKRLDAALKGRGWLTD